jgi:hypothetical protein
LIIKLLIQIQYRKDELNTPEIMRAVATGATGNIECKSDPWRILGTLTQKKNALTWLAEEGHLDIRIPSLHVTGTVDL